MRTTSARHEELMHRPVRVKRFGRIVCGTIIDTVDGKMPDGSVGNTYVGILPRAAQDVEISGEWINLNEVEFEDAPIPTPPCDDRTPLSALRSPEAYIDHLEADTRFRLDAAARTPALDSADLWALFQANKDAAWQQLASLNERQLVVQAHAMASYLSSEGTVVSGEAVLARWQAALAKRAAIVPTAMEAAVAGALERLAEESARSARAARREAKERPEAREDARFHQRSANAYLRALSQWNAGVRPERTSSGGWLLPSRTDGQPHRLTMEGDWICTCPAGESMHWAKALIVGIEVGGDDLDNHGHDCGETAVTPEPSPTPPAVPVQAAPTLGQRIAAAQRRVMQEAA